MYVSENKETGYMFEKKEIIYSETLGVCQVAELTRLGA